MKSVLLTALAAATLSIALPAAAQNVAIVNGKPVPMSRVDTLVAQISKAGRPVPPEAISQVKEEVILREVFMQEAQKRGLDASDDFKQQMELARQSILIRELFADYQKNNPVSDAEIKDVYDKVVAASGEKEYKVSHILLEKEDQAKAVIAQLKKGGKFADIAKKQSKDPGSAPKGGDLDWTAPGNLVPEFAKALTAMQKGQTSETPVQSQFGWHVIRVDDVREAPLPKLEEVRPQIAQQLQQQKLAQFQENLRKSAKVE